MGVGLDKQGGGPFETRLWESTGSLVQARAVDAEDQGPGPWGWIVDVIREGGGTQ